jgi:hypothetical protein
MAMQARLVALVSQVDLQGRQALTLERGKLGGLKQWKGGVHSQFSHFNLKAHWEPWKTPQAGRLF